jgi:hypothetical protein
MNDERFFDLAMKVIARQCTDAERAELDTLLVREPELKTEFERLQADVRTAKDTLPLVDATQATAGELPAYARGRLQTKVRQTFGRPATDKEPDRSLARGWCWVLGLAATAWLARVPESVHPGEGDRGIGSAAGTQQLQTGKAPSAGACRRTAQPTGGARGLRWHDWPNNAKLPASRW